MKNILFFAGSNSPKSLNQSVVIAVSEMLKASNNTVINLRDYPMPIYSVETEQQDGVPENAKKLRTLIDKTESLVISVPENNGSVSAFFKNTMDWLSRIDKNYKILKNKSVLLLSASPVGGGANSIIHAETILKRLGASITGKVVISKFHEQLQEIDGKFQFKDESVRNEISELAAKLIAEPNA
jgi:chromate reductase